MRPVLAATAVLLLTPALLAGLSACGQAPSDEVSSLEPRARVAGHEARGERGLAPALKGDRPAEGQSPPVAVPGLGTEEPRAPGPLPDHLEMPDWMATALASPDVRVRRHALDQWAQQGPTALLDPLVVALEDEDEQVRAKAMELIEQNWAQEQQRNE